MNRHGDAFDDYVYRGMGAMLRFTSTVGEKLREASNGAVEKLDALQLEKKRDRLYHELGVLSYRLLSSGTHPSYDCDDVRALRDSLDIVNAELERRKANAKDFKKAKKNDADY